MEHDFLCRFSGKFPGATGSLAEKVVLFSRSEYMFHTKIRGPLLQSHF